MRVALITNIPAPYRVPVYDRLAAELGRDFRVFYMASRADWEHAKLGHASVFLEGRSFVRRDGVRDLHVRWGLLRKLRELGPDVVVTGGFNPPMLLAALYGMRGGRRHVAITDAWPGSEADLSPIHRGLRRLVYARSAAFAGASEKSLELFRSYGASTNLFLTPLSSDNEAFARVAGPLEDRPYDVGFVGRMIPRKVPLFFADVVKEVARRRGRVRALVVGGGELQDATRQALEDAAGVDVDFTGAVEPRELPELYAQMKLLCFPTDGDAWGLVANEASASGMPVVTCAKAGCAGELVRDGETGRVVPLTVTAWADAVSKLLADGASLRTMGHAARRAVDRYTFDAAADGILAACRAAASTRS